MARSIDQIAQDIQELLDEQIESARSQARAPYARKIMELEERLAKAMDGQPNTPFTAKEDWPTVYVTNEQIQRLAALSLDALTGIQFRTDDSDQTTVVGCFVQIENPDTLTFLTVYTDGRAETST